MTAISGENPRRAGRPPKPAVLVKARVDPEVLAAAEALTEREKETRPGVSRGDVLGELIARALKTGGKHR